MNDEIKLITEKHLKNKLNQYYVDTTEIAVFANLKSVTSRELADAGTVGHKAEGIAEVFVDNYNGQDLVRISEPNPILKEGTYEVYRKYVKEDIIELYLKERAGL